MEAPPNALELEATEAAAEDAVDTSNGFDVAERGLEVKEVGKHWKGAAEGEKEEAGAGVTKRSCEASADTADAAAASWPSETAAAGTSAGAAAA